MCGSRCKTITDFNAIKCIATVLSEIDGAEYLLIADPIRSAATSATRFLLSAMDNVTSTMDGASYESEAAMIIRALHRMSVGDSDVVATLLSIVDVVVLVANGRSMDVKNHVEFTRALAFFSLLNIPLTIMDMVKEADAPVWVAIRCNKPN